jgi:hypothetical protein
MLDVHPPERGIHGIRDFFIHLMTITVGLLIALGLENAVEAVHHRHQRKEAEVTLRQANIRITLDVYTQAVNSNKRAAQSKVVRMMVSDVGQKIEEKYPQIPQ